MIPSLLRNIYPNQDSEGTALTIIQQWITQACINASIPITSMDPLLRDIVPGQDTESIKLAIIQRWLTNLANGISSGGGGAGPQVLQAGFAATTTGASQQAIVFGTAFATTAPAIVCNLIPPNGGTPILCVPQSVTTTGFTGYWGFPVPAGYFFSWQALKPTQ